MGFSNIFIGVLFTTAIAWELAGAGRESFRDRQRSNRGRGRGRDPPGRSPGHDQVHPIDRRPQARNPSNHQLPIRIQINTDDLIGSLVSNVDHNVLLNNLGDRWLNFWRNNRSTHRPGEYRPTHGARPQLQEQQVVRDALHLPHSGEWIRLRADKGFVNAGLVEVYRAGRWGLVCDDSWDIRDATVACKQLGFREGAQSAPTESYYGLTSGRWGSDDIIMDDVECEGSESALQYCTYEDKHDCSLSEAASVACKPNKGCPEGWHGSGNKCYRFFSGAQNIKAAGAKCLELNASLVSVESEQENHFLSNMISLSVAKEQPETMWYTSGRLSKNTWRWSKNVDKSTAKSKKGKKDKKDKKKNKKDPKNDKKGKGRKNKREITIRRRTRAATPKHLRTVRASVDVTRWFPGWLPAGEGREPSNKKGHTCLVLTDRFALLNGTEVSVDYFYWKAQPCRQKDSTITFICELPAVSLPGECYEGNGADYRGTISHTDVGTECIAWTDAGINLNALPGKGLGSHNYCRNPDNDKRPWCYVARGKFGFCSVKPCSEITTANPDVVSTTIVPEDMQNCPDEEFFCAHDSKCLPEQYHCDGEEDCNDGSDETDCEYKVVNFEEHDGRAPAQILTNLTYANTPLETCANLCLKNDFFRCVSFLYNEDERQCQILDTTTAPHMNVHLLPSPQNDYYMLRTEVENCTGKFHCGNHKCIAAGLKCNGQDDCGDLSDEQDCITKPEDLKVRLVGGDERTGRVEINYLGQWGTICDDRWDIRDGHVVCRMLGYTRASQVFMLGEFGSGDGNILLDEVECLGTEKSLIDCPASPWKKHDCQAFESAGVQCLVSKSCENNQFVCNRSRDPLAQECVDADKVCDGVPTCSDFSDESNCVLKVELLNGTSRNEGRVELVRNGLRGTICDDEFGEEEANVVCKMLGHRYGGEAVSEARFGQGSGLIWLDDLSCTGTESSLAYCPHKGWAQSDCSHLEDVGVICYLTRPTPKTTTTTTTTPLPESVRVQLVGGTRPNEGRVELEIGAFQGTICDDSFDNRDAAVICRMAGYRDGGRAVLGDSGFGAGSEVLAILLDELECTGDEDSVLDCNHLDLGNHNCGHSEDAGVQCFVPGLATTTNRPPIIAITGDPPTSILDGTICGLRPIESSLRRLRRQAEDGNLTALREVAELPRYQKIVGGDLAQHGMYPWQVGVQKIYNIYDNGDIMVGHWCGGTIINKHWVLSAAHCFTSLPKSRVLLKVGDHGLKVDDEGEQKFFVEELIPHRSYNRDTHDYDIALMKVKSADGQGIKFSDYVQPACLPSSASAYQAGLKCHISGWGETGEDSSPNHLREADVPLLTYSTCNYLYKNDLTRRMLCAGYLEGGIDTCQGDSGGPLVCNIDGAYTLLGVTSWGFGCAKPNSPGVYARTIEFLAWIESTIRLYS